MPKKVNQNGTEFSLVEDKRLENIRYAFVIESSKTIFVSPAIYSLIESDPELVRKHLKTIKMPIKTVGKITINKFVSLGEWLAELLQNKEDIFCIKKDEKKEVIIETKDEKIGE